MPETGSIVQWIFELVDGYLIGMVATTVSRVIEVSVPVVVAAGTLMFLFYGVSIMRGAINEPVLDFVGRATKIALVVSFATAGGLYQSVIMDIALSLPTDAVSAITSSDGSTLPQRLDEGLNTSSLLASKVKGDADWWSMFHILGNLALALVFTITGALVAGLGLITLLTVKVATGLLVALGPVFILCLIFESTKGFFDRWVHQLVNYMLLAVLFSILIEMILSIQGQILRMSAIDIDNGDYNLFQLIGVYGLFVLGVVFLIFQLPSIAGSLAGGFGLQISSAPLSSLSRGMSRGGNFAMRAMRGFRR